MNMKQKSNAKKKTTPISLSRLESFGSDPLDGGFDPEKQAQFSSYDIVQQASRPHLESSVPRVRQQARNFLNDLDAEGYELTGHIELEGGKIHPISSKEARMPLSALLEEEGISAAQLSRIEYELSKQARGGCLAH
jgi:hypothetical protein